MLSGIGISVLVYQRQTQDKDMPIDVVGFVAYHSTMTNDETNTLQPEQDPLTVGDLITLQEAAEYAGLSKESIHSYVKKGRLKAKKRGWMWFTTRTAVDEYLRSRHLENIPKKYRKND
jgi:excisionase family DNA binding protein